MKQTFKISIAVMLLIFSSHSLHAQKSLTLGTDPLTVVALRGFELEGGFSFAKNRITASYLQGALTPWYGQAADFKETSHSVVELGYSRWFNEEQKGLNIGLALTQFTSFRVENELGEALGKRPTKVGVRLAYAWFPFEKVNVFVEPIVTLGFMVRDKDLNFASGEIFEAKSFIGNGPVLNVGYKFNLNK